MKILGITGHSGSGKTTLLCHVIPLLRENRLQVAAIKATHHDIRWDTPGKDSYRLQEAGADPVLLQGPQRWYMARRAVPGDWDTLVASLQPPPDLVLSEGNHGWEIPGIEVYRSALGKPRRCPAHGSTIAIASDGPIPGRLPVLDLNRPQEICEFILQWYGESRDGHLL